MDAPTDEMLLREYLAGQTASFELLVRRHAEELYKFALRFTASRVAAEDVVQETFLQVHLSASTFDPKRRLKPWIFTIAANKARDYLRRRDRKREVPFDAEIGGEEKVGKRFIDLISSNRPAPDAELMLDEKRRLVRDVIETLPGKWYEILILAYYHRFPYRDIAEIVGIPVGTVKSRVHTAIAVFADRYVEAVEEYAKRRP